MNTKVAVVDDHQLVRTGLVQMIHTIPGWEVMIEAANGKDFIDQTHPLRPPDIVLLDIRMPIMDGYETALWIRSHLPETRVLVVSMVSREPAVIRMLRLGIYGFISKDTNMAELHQALKRIQQKQFHVNELVGNRIFHYFSDSTTEQFPDEKNDITDREFIFLRKCCSELTYRQIAKEMHVSPRTIDTYRDHLFEKLQVRTRVGLVIYALRTGLIEVDDLV
jgi:two-component system invasion response regulator UvrY